MAVTPLAHPLAVALGRTSDGKYVAVLVDADGVVQTSGGGGGLTAPVILTEAVGSSAFTITGATQTASFPALNITQTWNNAGVTFTGVKVNVTNTASNAASKLFDFQVGGTTKLWGRVDGYLGLTASTTNLTGFYADPNLSIFVDTSSASVQITSGSLFKMKDAMQFGWTSGAGTGTLDVILARDAANVLAQRNSTNAQTFRLYNTYTDASNYERMTLTYDGTQFSMGAQQAGTGSARNLRFYTSAGFKMDADSGSEFRSTSGGTVYGKVDNKGFRIGGSYDITLARASSGVAELNSGTAGTYRDLTLRNIVGQTGYHEMVEMTAPGAGAANTARVYVEDNGAGKTRLMVQFPTGAAVQLAIEP